MTDRQDLFRQLDHAAQLRVPIIAFVQTELADELEALAGELASDNVVTAREHIEATEFLLYEGRVGPSQVCALDLYLERHPELTAEDREIIERFKEARYGVFLIETADGPTGTGLNVIDQQRYDLATNHQDPSMWAIFTPGTWISSRVLPVGDRWMLSGAQERFEPTERNTALAVAFSIVQERPELLLNNPAIIDKARRIAQQLSAHATAQHGKPWFSGSPGQVRVALDALYSALDPELRQDLFGGPADILRDPDLRDARTVVVLAHPDSGLQLGPELHPLLKALQDPSMVHGRPFRDAMAVLNDDPALMASVWEVLGQHRPEATTRLLRACLDRPDFDWATDGPDFLQSLRQRADAPLLPQPLPLHADLRQGAAELTRQLEAMYHHLLDLEDTGRDRRPPPGAPRRSRKK